MISTLDQVAARVHGELLDRVALRLPRLATVDADRAIKIFGTVTNPDFVLALHAAADFDFVQYVGTKKSLEEIKPLADVITPGYSMKEYNGLGH